MQVMAAAHAENYRKLAEQCNAATGQRCFVSVAGVVGRALPGFGLVHLRGHRLAVATSLRDGACLLEPRFVGRYPLRGHSEVAGMAEIGAEGLLVTAGQVTLLDSGQVEDGLSQSPVAGWAEAGSDQASTSVRRHGDRRRATVLWRRGPGSEPGLRSTLPDEAGSPGGDGKRRARSLAARNSRLIAEFSPPCAGYYKSIPAKMISRHLGLAVFEAGTPHFWGEELTWAAYFPRQGPGAGTATAC